jgi:hypothetical protein
MDPGESLPEGPPTPVKKRSAGPPDDKPLKFERQPQGSLPSAESFDVTGGREEPADVWERRPFRQSVSAGFQTHVITRREELAGTN